MREAETITLVFFRHGKAVSIEEAGSDDNRWLTSEGREDVRCVARLLPLTSPLILTSPLRRAVESAEIISNIMNTSYQVDARLLPSSFNKNVLKEILASLNKKEIILVGHSPSLENTAIQILSPNNKSLKIKLPAGGAMILEVTPSLERAILREIISPRIARKSCDLGS
ncbi:MAG: phosphoglycerate mutase family protein [Pyrodictiaceae archaeon]